MKLMQDMENNEKEGAEMGQNERVYEVGYLVVPTLSEEEVPAIYGNLKELVSSLGGVHVSDEMPKLIQLAYPMVKVIANVHHKFTTGYFGWIKFTMEADKIEDMKNKLDLDPNIIRFLILKTVKENTIAAKRFVRPDAHKKPKAATGATEEGEAAPINKEEIDKEIDAMVA